MRTVRNAVFVLVFVNLVFMAWAHWIDVPVRAACESRRMRICRGWFCGRCASGRAEGHPAAVTAPAVAPAAAAAPLRRGHRDAPTPAAHRCVSVGPFNDVAQETHAGSLLQERGLTPQQRTEAGDVR